MSPTTTAARAITLPLGTAPDSTPVHWHLTDTTGRPLHGLIVGGSGRGASVAFARLAAQARAAGGHVSYADIDHPDPRVLSHVDAWSTSAYEISRELRQALADPSQITAPGPRLVLVDGTHALAADITAWTDLVRRSAELGVSVVARVHDLPLNSFGGNDVLRDCLAASGQYLALGRPFGASSALVRDLLPGYAPPAYRGRPGTGVYGYGGRSVPVTVTCQEPRQG